MMRPFQPPIVFKPAPAKPRRGLSVRNPRRGFTAAGLAGCLGLCWLALSVSAASAQTYDLRPQWTAGQSATYSFWTARQQNQTVTMPTGESRNATNSYETNGELQWTVESIRPDGGATGTMTMDWIAVTLTDLQGQTVTMDSRKPRGDVPRFQKLLKAMVGKPITVTVNADGTIEKVAGLGPIRRAAEEPDDVPEDLDWIESATDLATVPGVPPEVRIGGTWKKDFRWTHDEGHLRHAMTYTLADVEDVAGIPLATVEGKGTLKLDPKPLELPPDAPPVQRRLTGGEVTTQILFDLQRHEAVGRNTTQEETIVTTIRFPQGTIRRSATTTIQSQVLRLSEE